MKKISTLALVAMVALSASAAKKKAPSKGCKQTRIYSDQGESYH